MTGSSFSCPPGYGPRVRPPPPPKYWVSGIFFIRKILTCFKNWLWSPGMDEAIQKETEHPGDALG